MEKLLEACQPTVDVSPFLGVKLGIAHGDLNRYNFIVGHTGIALIDLENAIHASKEAM